jgi:hypothetical protein
MNWQLYQLRFRVLSPLHIGYQKVGNIQRTRHYVMARQMWGALTAKLTRGALYGEWTLPAGVSPGDYEKMGELVSQQIAFSYLYPESESSKPLFPYQSQNGLAYGFNEGKEVLPADVFAWRYLNSYASTALDYNANAAEEGSLHETEFIAPKTRPDGSPCKGDVYLTGYVFVRTECVLSYWPMAIRELQIGGERKSGWGRVRLIGQPREVTKPDEKLFGLIEYDLSTGQPTVVVKTEMPLLSHASLPPVSGQAAITFNGSIEPLTYRAWDQHKGAGQDIQTKGVYYTPGTVLKSQQSIQQEPNTQHMRFMINQYGLWDRP